MIIKSSAMVIKHIQYLHKLYYFYVIEGISKKKSCRTRYTLKTVEAQTKVKAKV